MEASDKDKGKNAEIIYSIEGPTFSVDQSNGNIKLKKALSYGDQSSYELIITATDKGSPPLFGTAVLKVEVLGMQIVYELSKNSEWLIVLIVTICLRSRWTIRVKGKSNKHNSVY